MLTDFGKAEAICAGMLDDPTNSEGVLLKVMTRGPFEEGQQFCLVESVFKHTINSK